MATQELVVPKSIPITFDIFKPLNILFLIEASGQYNQSFRFIVAQHLLVLSLLISMTTI